MLWDTWVNDDSHNVMKRDDDIKIMLNRITLRPNHGDEEEEVLAVPASSSGQFPYSSQMPWPCRAAGESQARSAAPQ